MKAVADKVGDDPAAALYASERKAQILVSPMGSVERGFHIEREPSAILSSDCSTEMLGQAVWESLLQFRRVPNLNPRSRTLADWPAYRASRMKSFRAFEDEYVHVSVTALPSVLRVSAIVPVKAADGLFVGVLLPMPASSMHWGNWSAWF
jgi:hypothetical protein